MSGRPLLHRLHNASVYNQRGPISFAEVPHEIRTQQVTKTSHSEDYLRVAVIHRHESTSELDVFQGTQIERKQKHCFSQHNTSFDIN